LLPRGGFFKNDVEVYDAPWNGSDSRAGWTGTGADDVELGTIDNGATLNELLFLADVYQRSSRAAYRDAVRVTRPAGNTDDSYNPIQGRAGSTMWCRFYELDRDECIFSGRLPSDDPPGNGKQADIMDIEPERRYGYQWGGNYGSELLAYAKSVVLALPNASAARGNVRTSTEVAKGLSPNVLRGSWVLWSSRAARP
jgi:hypothetical protein